MSTTQTTRCACPTWCSVSTAEHDERAAVKVYASFSDLVQHEVRPAMLTDETLTEQQVNQLAPVVAQRLQDAGLIVWHDGYDEGQGVYWLPAQGFAMPTTGDDDDADFWAIVADVLGDAGVQS